MIVGDDNMCTNDEDVEYGLRQLVLKLFMTLIILIIMMLSLLKMILLMMMTDY